MPQNVESLILDMDKLPENKSKNIPVNCLWTITSKEESLTVIVTCLKWRCNYNFCVRVTAHPQGAPNLWKQIGLDNRHPVLRSLTDAPNLYEAFPEPHLKTHQLDILEKLKEYFGFPTTNCPVNAFWDFEACVIFSDFSTFSYFKWFVCHSLLKQYVKTIQCICTRIITKTWIQNSFHRRVLLHLLTWNHKREPEDVGFLNPGWIARH